jgi:HK97 family phage major capsid protein
MKQLIRYVFSTPVQAGMRLFCVCLFMVTGMFTAALLAGITPMVTPMNGILGLTATEEAEKQALLTEIKAAAKAEVDTAVKAINADGEKKIESIVEQKIAAFKDLPVDKLKALVTEMKEVNDAIAQLKAKAAASKKGKKATMLQKALEENWKPMQERLAAGAKSFSFKLEEKVTSSSFGDRVIFGFRESGIDIEALPELFILDLIQVMSGGPGSNPLSWIERNLVEAAAASPMPAFVAEPTLVNELGVKPSMSWEWVERKLSSATIAAMAPVSKQAVFNYAQLESEIRFELLRRIAQVLEYQILRGSGAGSPTQLKGIMTYAQAFSAGDFAATIPYANYFDVLVAAATQILNANFVPTVGVISHTAKGQMNMAKNVNGTYVMPPFSTNGGLNVYGMRIMSTNHFTGDEFLVMDPTRSLFNWVENPTIEVGMINDDFERNIWRLRCELQGVHRIKEHEKVAFVKGDFSDAIGTLEV